MYVYIKSEPGLWTVGFYKPDGTWEAESDHSSDDKAADRVSYLNGNHQAGPATSAPRAPENNILDCPLRFLRSRHDRKLALSPNAASRLERSGIRLVSDIIKLSRDEVRKTPGLKTKMWQQRLEMVVAQYGLRFKGEPR